MEESKIKWGWIIGGSLLFIALIIGLYFLIKPILNPVPAPGGNGNGNVSGSGNGEPPCVPYTQAQKKAELQECFDGCNGMQPISAFHSCVLGCVAYDKDNPIKKC